MRSRLIFALQGAILGAALYAMCSLAIAFLVFDQVEAFALEAPTGATQGSPTSGLVLIAVGTLALLGILELLRRSPGSPALTKLASAGLVTGGVLAGAAVSVPAWSAAGHSALQAEIAALEADGLAPPEPSLPPKPPDADNAVILLLEAQAKYQEAANDDADPAYKEVLPALERFAATATTGAEFEAALPLLEAQRVALDLAMQAADRKAAWWDLDVGPDTPAILGKTPDHVSLVPIARLLTIRAISESKAGDAAAAARSIDAALAMGDALGASPLLISAMVRAVIISTALPPSRHLFDTAPELAIAKETWGLRTRPEPLLEHVKTAYRFELVAVPREIASGRFGNPAASLGSEGPAAKLFGGAFYFGIRRALHGQRPLLASAMADTLPQPPPRMLARAGRAAAELAVARGAVAWSTERVADGTWLGKDPWAAGHLKSLAVAASGGTLVYSVGPDGKDDTGAAFDEDSMAGDISWLIRESVSR